MKKKFITIFGLLTLVLSACANSAAPTPTESLPATEISTHVAETPTQPAPTDTVVPTAGATSTSAPTETSTVEVSFANDVMPILNNSCTKCHGVEQVKEGLNLRSYNNLMSGSFNGPVIVPGNAGESLLIELVSNGKMPKRGPKLTPEQIQIIINWINTGALNN